VDTPSYLRGYDDQYARDPRGAALSWFRDAKYGLFLHYGLYSVLARHEWAQHLERIPVADYAEQINQFTAEGFDADYIADFALDCGMKYVNITTRHHDSFCLWDTKETPFNSMNAPAHRDLVGELAEACRKRGLGLFLYYSHGRDWRHPHGPRNDQWGGRPRPEYDPPDPAYAPDEEYDLRIYVDFMAAQIRELLTRYGPIAGIWLDGLAVPKSGDHLLFRVEELYAMIRALQPQCLITYKEGLLGTEDISCREYKAPEKTDKPMEICDHLHEGRVWGYALQQAGHHKKADEVWEMIRYARGNGCCLLLNSAPLPDGGIDPEDDATLRAVGTRIRSEITSGSQESGK
jgi:alpha-L-fucosidase